MADFFNTYGFLIVSMIFGAILGISIYLPLMAGQLSLATPGFYALGGYVAAILSTKKALVIVDEIDTWMGIITSGMQYFFRKAQNGIFS